MQDYQVIATESLGLAQRKLIPRIAQLSKQWRINLNEGFSQIFNNSIEVEIDVQLSQVLPEQNDWVYTSVDISKIGTLSVAISTPSLAQLTAHYLSEPINEVDTVDSTSLRFLDRLAKMLAQQVTSEYGALSIQMGATQKLPKQAVILTFTLSLMACGQRIQFELILDSPLVEKLTEGYLPAVTITREAVEASLSTVEVSPNVVLMQHKMTLGEISSLAVGDVISMELNREAPLLVGDKQLFSGQVSDHAGRLQFTVNNIQEK